MKTNHIKVCQSCHKNYNGLNDTLELVVAHAERHLIRDLATGVLVEVPDEVHIDAVTAVVAGDIHKLGSTAISVVVKGDIHKLGPTAIWNPKA